MDGGIRSGQDVLKAWALGAGTMIGRAMVYGLGAMGEAGVTKALQIIHKELDVTMAFCGHTDLKKVDRGILVPGTFPGERPAMNHPDGDRFDTVVVGAGIAGLATAALLAKDHGQRVLVLERAPFIGGRALSYVGRGTSVTADGSRWTPRRFASRSPTRTATSCEVSRRSRRSSRAACSTAAPSRPAATACSGATRAAATR